MLIVTTTDPDLLNRVRDWREDEGWREFYARYAPAINAHARRSGLSPEEAQDVVQATMVKIATYIPTFHYNRSFCRFRTWLNQIVNQRVIGIWKERRKTRLPEEVVADLRSLMGIDLAASGDQVAQTELDHQMVHLCLARTRIAVKAHHWQIFEANTIYQLSAREVARRYGTTVANVWVIRHRLLRRFKEEWHALLNEPFELPPCSRPR
jgi:RNA polymerase sigma factor (sigma-70 family)